MREIRRISLARFISSVGFEATFFIGLWGKLAFDLDADTLDLALLAAAAGIAQVVGGLAGGVLVDRWDARRVVVAAEVLFVPATLSLLVPTSVAPLVMLGGVVFLVGAVIETAVVSMPPRLVDDSDLESANAELESANWLALMAGPAVGAVLARAVGTDAVFVLDAVTSVIAVLLVRKVPLRPMPAYHAANSDEPSGVAFGRELLGGLRLAATEPAIRLVLVLGVLTWVGFGTFIALEPLFFRDVVGTEVDALGWVNSVFGIGLFLGAQGLARASGAARGFRAAVGVTVAAGLGSILYVGTSSLAVVVVGAIVWSIPLGAAIPMWRTLAQRATPETHMGRVMGTLSTLQAASSVFPAMVAPALAAALGVQGVLVASGVLIVVVAPLLWPVAARLDGAKPLGAELADA